MEKGERFEKGGPAGKVNVGRWKDRWNGWMFEGEEDKFSTGMGAGWEKKEILKEKVGWKRVRDLRKGGRGER